MAGDPTSKGMYPARDRNGERIPVAVLGEAMVVGLDDFDRWRDGLRKANVDRQGRSAVRRRPRHADRLPVPQVHQDADALRPGGVLRTFYARCEEVLRRKLGWNAMESIPQERHVARHSRGDEPAPSNAAITIRGRVKDDERRAAVAQVSSGREERVPPLAPLGVRAVVLVEVQP